MMVSPKRPLLPEYDPAASYVGDRYAFDEFRLWPASRVLTRNNVPVQLGARALDILIALVERAGQVVGKTELFALVWPNRSIEESNLRVHIAALRKALGDGRSATRFITSVPGRGYTFVAEVVHIPRQDEKKEQRVAPLASLDHAGFPAALTPLFGRDEVVAEIADQLPRKRLVTITGAGGIGKTAVALAVAMRAANSYRDGLQIIDLAPLAHPSLLAAHLASLLRLPAVNEEESLPKILAHLRPRAQLIVLDNCEHVIGAASEIAEAILAHAPDIRLLATSREPLRSAGEWVQRLTPLAVPPSAPTLNATEAMRFAAVQLFVERLRAWDGSFVLADSDAQVIAEICAHLDGLPLAIELAATRVPLFGLRGLADRLGDRFKILTKGRRTAVARHQTLGAMIDWSYQGLSEEEKTVWRRLSIFPSFFTLQAADAIVNDKSGDAIGTVDALDDLLQKSLIVSDSSNGETRYRLLESLRLYAFTELLENQEAEYMRRRHAQYWYERSVGSGDTWLEVPKAEWLVRHGGDVADLRAALDWAFAPGGDPALGIRIVAASAPFWFKMLLLPELRRYLERAIPLSEGMTEIEDAERIRLHIALGQAMIWSKGWGAEEVKAAFSRARELATAASNADERFQIFYGLTLSSLLRGELRLARQTAEIFLREATAEGRAAEAAVANRNLGLTCFFQGEITKAQACLEEGLRIYDPKAGRDSMVHFAQDHRAVAAAFLAKANWVLGEVGRARELIEGAITRATEAEHMPTLANVYLFRAYIEMLRGDAEAVLSSAETVIEICREHGLAHSLAYGETFLAWARARLADGRTRATMLGDALVALSSSGNGLLRPIFRGLLAELEAEERGFEDALRRIDEALAFAATSGEHWTDAVLYRIRGELLLKFGATASAAEEAFRTAIDIARQQKARSFELAAAVPLAKLYQSINRPGDAHALLASALQGFSPTPEFPKIAEAQALLNALAP
ncbi:MAG: winged helix-turn-helix domain-containing protein [Methylovirgula sp.]|nr:winged helix-turn-helix domain-containing protein [Methylovirgula sp.]